MKKRVYLTLAICLMALCLLVGCTPEQTPDETDSTTLPDTTETAGGETETPPETETETETEYDDPALKLDHLTVGGVDISEYTVVVPTNPAPYDQQAADFLIRFIAEATGVTLPQITDAETADRMILIGTTAHDTDAVKAARAEITENGYAMVMDGGNLFITGNNDHGLLDTGTIGMGTVCGVYDFLDQYVGVRMYGIVKDQTTSENTELYEIKNCIRMDIPEDLCTVFNPSFSNYSTDWNIFHTANPVYPRWNGYIYGGSSFTYRSVHTIGDLCEIGHVVGEQPCLTDENIYQTVLKNVRAWLEKDPGAVYIDVSQNDSFADQLGCQCENCLAIEAEEGSPSGPWIRFVNRIANDIKDEYPDILVSTLAYRYTEKPPKVTKPAENVAVRLCEINVCGVHALTDPDCPQNVSFCESIQGWAEICDHLMVWSYSANFLGWDNPSRNTFAPNLRVLLENAKFYKENNVEFVYIEGCPSSASPAGLSFQQGEIRAYLWGKALWNPDMTQEEFDGYLNDAMNYFYGDAAPLLMKYFDLLNNSMTENLEHCEYMKGHTTPFTDSRVFMNLCDAEGNYNTKFVDELGAIWEEIYALETLTEEQKLYVDYAAVQFYDAAADAYQLVSGETRDQATKKKAHECRQIMKELKERLGV